MKLSDILQEAPIMDYKVIGDFSKNSSYRSSADRALVSNEKLIAVTKEKFKKNHADFNMYFVNSPKANRHTEVGEVTKDWVKRELGDEVADQLNLGNDGINVIFTNNKGSQRIPMTPWIMAHRIGHVMQRYSMGGRWSNQYYREAHRDFVRDLSNILETGYGIKVPDVLERLEKDRQSQLIVRSFGHEVCTFRSARMKKIRDWFELINELFAQHVTTGRITFNPLPQRFGTTVKGNLTADKERRDDAGDMLDMLSRDMQYRFDDALSYAIGKIYVM